MKEQVVDQRYDPLRLLMPRWRHRPGRENDAQSLPGAGEPPIPKNDER
jgi:hypothetical protein